MATRKKLEKGTKIRLTRADDTARFQHARYNIDGSIVPGRVGHTRVFGVLRAYDTEFDGRAFTDCLGVADYYRPANLKRELVEAHREMGRIEAGDEVSGFTSLSNTLCIAEQLIAERLI